MNSRLTLSAVAAAATLFLAAPASAQVKSNIQDDPYSSSCAENCIDAGYDWAMANQPTEDGDCAARNEDFAAGCAHWLEETRESAAPPLEDPEPVMVDPNAPPVEEGTEAPVPPPED